MSFDFRLATRDEILKLRHAVLRPGKPLETAYFDCDASEKTLHFGVFTQKGDAIVCATITPSFWEDKPSWQLRGMATHPDYSRRGLGKALLELIENELKEKSAANHLWCNARESAFDFYQKSGWVFASEFFDIPGIGPHKKMIRIL